jgi:hypothetical protein
MPNNKTIPHDRALSRRKSTSYRLFISPQEHSTFIQSVEQGLTFASACRLAGLQPKCVRQWLERGEQLEDEPGLGVEAAQYLRFFLDFEQAKARYEQMHGVNINANAMGFTKTRPDVSQWALKTYFPGRYEDKYKIQQEADRRVSEIFQYLMSCLSDNAAQEIATALAGVKGIELQIEQMKIEKVA